MIGKSIFITGATGFIGENLALKLAERNQVYALVRPESIKKTTNLKEKGVQTITGDILNSNSYSEKLKGVDYVFHLAALRKLDAPKKLMYKYNVLGTQKLFEACPDKDIKKIIYFSTAYVAGTKEKEFIMEDEPYPKRFKNWYEWSKVEGEKIVFGFYKKYNLPIVILRPAIVYGPNSFWGFYDALSLISRGKFWVIPGSGKNKIHLIYVDDVVSAAIYLAEQEETTGKIYHLCDDNASTCNELVKILCKHLGIKLPVLHLPRYLARALIRVPFCKPFFRGVSAELLDYFLYHQSFSNKKLKTTHYLLRYTELENNLKMTIDWYRNNRILV